MTTYAGDPRYMGWRNFLLPDNHSYFGLRFSYETIPNQLLPFDYDTFDAYPGTVEAVVTNVQTGQAEYLPVPGETLPTCCWKPPALSPDVPRDRGGRQALSGRRLHRSHPLEEMF